MLLIFCPAPALAQTASETVAYIQGKVSGQNASFSAYELKIDGVELDGSVFVWKYTVTNDTNIGRWSDYFREDIDLTQVQDFTTKSADAWLKNDGVTGLQCDRSFGNCVKKQMCMTISQGKCSESRTDRASILYLKLSVLGNPEEEKRVKKAIIYLKGLFPLKKNIELFDNR